VGGPGDIDGSVVQEQRRPLLAGSRLNVDPVQKIMFVDEHWVRVDGGYAVAESLDGSIYLVISLRNFGAGIGVCQGWAVRVGLQRTDVEHVPEEELRPQSRDLYIPAGDVGLWQGAIRDPDDPDHAAILEAARAGGPLVVLLLYGDHEGGQRTIARFTVFRDDDDQMISSIGRYWNIDREEPR